MDVGKEVKWQLFLTGQSATALFARLKVSTTFFFNVQPMILCELNMVLLFGDLSVFFALLDSVVISRFVRECFNTEIAALDMN